MELIIEYLARKILQLIVNTYFGSKDPLKSVALSTSAVADLGGHSRRAPPLRAKIFLISCSFSQNLAKSYVGAPPRPGAPSYGKCWIRP